MNKELKDFLIFYVLVLIINYALPVSIFGPPVPIPLITLLSMFIFSIYWLIVDSYTKKNRKL